MRVDIKTVNGKDYIQIVDDNRFLHHVGPANTSSIAAAIFIKGQEESRTIHKWLENYYLSRGHELDKGLRKKISHMALLYSDGRQGLLPRGSEFYDLEEVKEITDRLNKMIIVHDLVKNQLTTEYHSKGIKVSDAHVRKRVKKVIRLSTDEYIDDFYQKYIEYIDNQIYNSLFKQKEQNKTK